MRRYARVGGLAALTSVLSGLAAADPSVAVAYCASINTASTSANSSTFQSEGLCFNFCNDDGYALGVLQDEDCWCSDYIPASDERVDTDECENACPGYPSDYCGGDGLYGYIQLSAAASGTKGGSSSTTSTSSTSTSSTTTATSTPIPTKTVTETLQASVTTSSSESLATSTSLTSSKSSEVTTSSKTTTQTTQSTTSSSTSKGSPTIITSVQTVTSEGAVTTQTVVTTAWPKADSSNGLGKGAIAGIVLGILALIAAFIAGAFLYRRHKKNQQLREQAPLSAALAGSHRRGSSAGIMSKTGTISSSGYGLGMEEDMSYASPGRRLSMKPMDPRLDFKQTLGLYRAASHDSINTIRDDQDYSRRVHDAPRIMRVTNPDPED